MDYNSTTIPSHQHALQTATRIAREAGALIRSHRGREHEVTEKSPHDLVTETDEAAQRLIVGRLKEAFPEHDVLAEEGAELDGAAQPPGRPRWIVDPLDGTTNFAHGFPPFCVSIALQDEGGQLVVGVIYEVVLDELFAAARGNGATMNGEPIRVSRTGDLTEALVTTGFPFREFWYVDAYMEVLRSFMFGTRGIRRPGSAAADLAYVACGRCDVFFEAGLAPWDVAAGIVIIEEAGGRVTGLLPEGDPLFGGQIAATNGILHGEVLGVVEPLGARYFGGEA